MDKKSAPRFLTFNINMTFFFIQVYGLMLKLHVQHASMSALVLLHTVSLWVTLTTGRVFSSHITKPHCSGTTVCIVGSISAVTRTTDSLVPILTNFSLTVKKTIGNLLSSTLLMMNNAQKVCCPTIRAGCRLDNHRTGALNHFHCSRVD